MNATMPLAALDFSQVPDLLQMAIRLFLALGGAALGYFAGGPVVRLLYRLAFQRPMPNTVATWSQLGTGVLVGVLVFLLVPIGGGGLGGFGGGGGGGWTGAGPGGDKDKGQGGKDKDQGGAKDKSGDQSKPAGKVLEIEVAGGEWYESGSGKYYFLRTAKTPAKFASVAEYQKHLRALKQVEDYLKTYKDEIQSIDILVYKNSPEPNGPPVRELVGLAEKYALPTRRPKEYHEKVKTLE